MAISSMTGFGAAEGFFGPVRWRWELRSVNARGLDLRLRLPEGWDALEAELRRRAQAVLRRGAVTALLRLDDTGSQERAALDPAALDLAVAAAAAAAARAQAAGLAVAPVSPEGLLRLPGVLERRAAPPDPETRAALSAAVADGFAQALASLAASRAAEGRALADSLSAVLDGIAARCAEAAQAHAAQAGHTAERLRSRVAALLAAGAPAEPDRLAQELALIAVRLDVREELDRLAAHVSAARALIAQEGGAGRQLDFLAQEFNREANTLCSKSDSAALTNCGLALKVLVDQLREQAQNVE